MDMSNELNTIGIVLEIVGFIIMLKSTKRLVLKSSLPNGTGMFDSDEYVDPKTRKPPKNIESSPNPLIFKPGITLVILGLLLQISSILFQSLNN